MEIIAFFLAAFISEIVGTVVGFGASTLFLPLSLFFFDFRTSLILVAVFHLFGTLNRTGFFRRSLKMDVLVTFGLPSVIATFPGALFAGILDQSVLKAVLGIFLLLYAGASLINGGIHFSKNKKNLVTGGISSGFIAGLIGTGGVIRGVFLTAMGFHKENYLATAAAVGVMVDLTRIPIYLYQGFLPPQLYWYILPLFIVAFIGTWIGKMLVEHLAERHFQRLVYLAIFLLGGNFLFDLLGT